MGVAEVTCAAGIDLDVCRIHADGGLIISRTQIRHTATVAMVPVVYWITVCLRKNHTHELNGDSESAVC